MFNLVEIEEKPKLKFCSDLMKILKRKMRLTPDLSTVQQ